ncbi:guanylate kinase [Brumicola pallidula]|jgi:guanylate kinase|uniref:Guanylate kinase n=1 Tax=Brumicola pallidula DSM 14239 = ACAM 615 TaxID=1121922 RepID=K6YSX3_9ALTE|nr:guanylate kinase [Glaciecola pallidula]GAC27086.1 guanylate kinase [Glaciecola pallidula DSM 14239 = ACAM 615]
MSKSTSVYIPQESAQQLGNLFIVAAPSGAGKSTLIKEVLNKPTHTQAMQLSVSHTTRAPRKGEQNGVEYHFVDHATFTGMIEQDAFYEYAEVFGNYYGTSKSAISDKLQQGIDVFLDIDWQGARQVKLQNPTVIGIFILPPSIQTLQTRLSGRGQDSDQVIAKRMAAAQSEMSHYNEFDFVIVNDNLAVAHKEFEAIISAQRLSLENQQIRYDSLFASLLAQG